MKRIIFLAGFGSLLLVALFWLSSHAFIEIIPESSNSITYNLSSQPANQTTTFTSSTSLKKIVRKGRYQLLARNGDTSSLNIIKVGGFLGKTTVSVTLAPEKARKFVGDNPASCMYYVNQVLATGSCGDLYSRLSIHVPATLEQPTYTKEVSGPVDGIVEGILVTKQGTIAVLRSSSGNSHVGYEVNQDLNLVKPVIMTDLDKNKSYLLQPYKDGFIVYDTALSQVFYYPSLSAKPSVIKVSGPKDKKVQPFAIKAQNNSLLIGFTDNPEDLAVASGNDDSVQAKLPKKTNVTVAVSSDNQTQEYSFTKRLSFFELCGTRKLCVLDTNKQLEVYDISASKPRFLFAINNVETAGMSSGSLLVTNKDGLLSIDVDKGSGYLEYSFGDYELCGVKIDNQGYLLCLNNASAKTAALFIDPRLNNTDSIDKKIAQVIKIPEIKSLSIYDKFIFVSPDLGSIAYQPSLRSFDYDPATTKTVNSKIKQAIDGVKIDRSVYKIINPFDH